MATKLVRLLISSYLLLAGDYHVVSGFPPVTYSSQSSTAECGQSDPLQDDQLMEALSKIHQELDATLLETDLVRKFSTASHQLPQATMRYVFPMAH